MKTGNFIDWDLLLKGQAGYFHSGPFRGASLIGKKPEVTNDIDTVFCRKLVLNSRHICTFPVCYILEQFL